MNYERSNETFFSNFIRKFSIDFILDDFFVQFEIR